MKRSKLTANAVDILHRRYLQDDPQRQADVQAERINAEVARLIYELRNDAGLSQKGLAKLVGTTQSVISRLEDADYEGHSLSMLRRVAQALNKRLIVHMAEPDSRAETIQYVFQTVMQNLRRQRGLTVDELAEELGIDRDDVVAMERSRGYRPRPLTLHKLSKFYGIPPARLSILAGATREVPESIQEQAARFAAQSESFAKLTREEKKLLDDFVKFLKTEV